MQIFSVKSALAIQFDIHIKVAIVRVQSSPHTQSTVTVFPECPIQVDYSPPYSFNIRIIENWFLVSCSYGIFFVHKCLDKNIFDHLDILSKPFRDRPKNCTVFTILSVKGFRQVVGQKKNVELLSNTFGERIVKTVRIIRRSLMHVS